MEKIKDNIKKEFDKYEWIEYRYPFGQTFCKKCDCCGSIITKSIDFYIGMDKISYMTEYIICNDCFNEIASTAIKGLFYKHKDN